MALLSCTVTSSGRTCCSGPDGPRVVDFGIAQLNDAETITSGLIGTPSYVVPEQLAGARPSSAVDVFAWALTMIFAAIGGWRSAPTACPPSCSASCTRSLSERPASVSAAIVRECLVKDSARRASARDLLLRIVDPSAQRIPAASHRPGCAGRLGISQRPTAFIGSLIPRFGLHRLADSAGRAHDLQGSRPGSLGPARHRRGSGGDRFWPSAVPPRWPPSVVVGVGLLTRGSPTGTPVGREQLVGRPRQQSGECGRAGDTGTQTTGVTIPAAFAGTWKGTATMCAIGVSTVRLKNSIAFTLVTGGRSAHENNQECIDTLTLSQVNGHGTHLQRGAERVSA